MSRTLALTLLITLTAVVAHAGVLTYDTTFFSASGSTLNGAAAGFLPVRITGTFDPADTYFSDGAALTPFSSITAYIDETGPYTATFPGYWRLLTYDFSGEHAVGFTDAPGYAGFLGIFSSVSGPYAWYAPGPVTFGGYVGASTGAWITLPLGEAGNFVFNASQAPMTAKITSGAVPEPTGLAFGGLAALALGARLRRRKA